MYIHTCTCVCGFCFNKFKSNLHKVTTSYRYSDMYILQFLFNRHRSNVNRIIKTQNISNPILMTTTNSYVLMH